MSHLAAAALMAPASDDSLTGRLVEGRYLVGRRIGAGACGTVYAARALEPAPRGRGRRLVALKVLSRKLAGQPAAVLRFTHEAYLGTCFHHPSLVPVLDFGRLEDDRPYCVMELCRGASLDKVLRDTGPLPRPLVAALISDASRGLAVLHAHGIVHRDVKPANLFVTVGRQGRPRLRILDLGVAGVYDMRRARKLGVARVGATGTHGTPAYIAPEQALGLPVDGRADVYALGCVAYRMLTGADPLRGPTLSATVRAHLFDTPRPASALNPTLAPGVDAVLLAALAKHPAERPRSVTAFARQLGRQLGDRLLGRNSSS